MASDCFQHGNAIGTEKEMSDAQTSQGPNDGAAAH
jgi:hypothetical protein